jgi:hypothetical protein
MRLLSIIVGLLASLIVVGCGGGHKEAAKAPETNPWADYKGTYGAGGSEASTAPVVEAKPASTAEAKPKSAKPKPTDAKAMYGGDAAKPDEEVATAAPAPTPRKATAKKRGGKGTGAKKATGPRQKSS